MEKPEFIIEFIPISLCNVMYKVITNIIVQRLESLMPNLISPFQSSFISGRNIQDNIIVAQGLIHTMRNVNRKKGFFANKVDIEKAYNRLNWNNIQNVLIEVGLPIKMVDVMFNCITSSTMNVLWNGSKKANFKPSRGIC